MNLILNELSTNGTKEQVSAIRELVGAFSEIRFDESKYPTGLRFATRGVSPFMAIVYLSLMFPGVSFHVSYCGQDDLYCGAYTIIDGKLLEERHYEEGQFEGGFYSDEAMEIYFAFNSCDGWVRDEYGYWFFDFDEEDDNHLERFLPALVAEHCWGFSSFEGLHAPNVKISTSVVNAAENKGNRNYALAAE